MPKEGYTRGLLSYGELSQPEQLAAKIKKLAAERPEARYLILELDWRSPGGAVTSGPQAKDDL